MLMVFGVWLRTLHQRRDEADYVTETVSSAPTVFIRW